MRACNGSVLERSSLLPGWHRASLPLSPPFQRAVGYCYSERRGPWPCLIPFPRCRVLIWSLVQYTIADQTHAIFGMMKGSYLHLIAGLPYSGFGQEVATILYLMFKLGAVPHGAWSCSGENRDKRPESCVGPEIVNLLWSY